MPFLAFAVQYMRHTPVLWGWDSILHLLYRHQHLQRVCRYYEASPSPRLQRQAATGLRTRMCGACLHLRAHASSPLQCSLGNGNCGDLSVVACGDATSNKSGSVSTSYSHCKADACSMVSCSRRQQGSACDKRGGGRYEPSQGDGVATSSSPSSCPHPPSRNS